MEQKYFKLFANCIPVKGAKRNIICDLQKGSIFFIPNFAYDLLIECKSKSVSEIKQHFNNEYNQELDDYFDDFISKELGFYTTQPENFPELDTKWESPSIINNAIIEYSSEINQHLQSLISQLNVLGCKYIEIRFYNKVSNIEIENVISNFEKSKIRSISLLIQYNSDMNARWLKQLLLKYQRIGDMLLSNISTDNPLRNELSESIVSFSDSQINSETHCGAVSPDYFLSNISLFFESMAFNTCLNKKIAICKDGKIKNCPSMSEDFGNISSTPIVEAIFQKDFKKLWKINKDEILVCQDCEFRYICTDCRAYIEDPQKINSKPLKCNYDPYSGVWL